MIERAKTKLVIFDCDGVLADSEVISARVLIQKLTVYGLELTEDYVFRNYVGQSFPKVAEKIRATHKLDLADDFEASYRENLLRRFGQELSRTAGVADVLRQLAIPACVATSSSPPRVARTLDLLKLNSFFENSVFTASEVENGKPAPDLFLHVAKTKGIAAENCLVIEDSMAGILAAQAAGMPVWRYVGASHMRGFTHREIGTPLGIPVFDKWDEFYQMAPQLMRERAQNGQAS